MDEMIVSITQMYPTMKHNASDNANETQSTRVPKAITNYIPLLNLQT